MYLVRHLTIRLFSILSLFHLFSNLQYNYYIRKLLLVIEIEFFAIKGDIFEFR